MDGRVSSDSESRPEDVDALGWTDSHSLYRLDDGCTEAFAKTNRLFHGDFVEWVHGMLDIGVDSCLLGVHPDLDTIVDCPGFVNLVS